MIPINHSARDYTPIASTLIHREGLPLQGVSGASPEQSSCGETRHDGAKEQENADSSESRRLTSNSEIGLCDRCPASAEYKPMPERRAESWR
jgi:hypothetical protein